MQTNNWNKIYFRLEYWITI